MSRDKVISTVEKLLRLAAPSSGAPEPERESAALEAARLISEHELEVVEPEPEKKRRRREVEDEEVRVRPSAWVLSVALDWCGCAHCLGLIAPRDVVWLRVIPGRGLEHRHNYGECAIKT